MRCSNFLVSSFPSGKARGWVQFCFWVLLFSILSLHQVYRVTVPLTQALLQSRAGTTHIFFFLPLVFPQAEQLPFLSFSISATIFCPFYLLRVAKTQGIGEASHQFTCAGLSPSTGLMNALKTSKRMVNVFIPTACSSSQTSHFLKVSSLLLDLRAHGTKWGQQLLHHLCPLWFWTTDAILHFLVTPA